MHYFNIKDDVVITRWHPKMLVTWPIIAEVFSDFGYDCTLTSGREGNHMNGSLHYLGKANDFRTFHVGDPVKIGLIAADISRRLGPDYDVVVEHTHIHVEYDPK